VIAGSGSASPAAAAATKQAIRASLAPLPPEGGSVDANVCCNQASNPSKPS